MGSRSPSCQAEGFPPPRPCGTTFASHAAMGRESLPMIGKLLGHRCLQIDRPLCASRRCSSAGSDRGDRRRHRCGYRAWALKAEVANNRPRVSSCAREPCRYSSSRGKYVNRDHLLQPKLARLRQPLSAFQFLVRPTGGEVAWYAVASRRFGIQVAQKHDSSFSSVGSSICVTYRTSAIGAGRLTELSDTPQRARSPRL